MRIGLIGKSNNKGLGMLTRNFVEHLPITKVLIRRDPSTYEGCYPNIGVYVDEVNVREYLPSFIKDIDVLIMLETLFDEAVALCKERKVLSALVVNYEYLSPDIKNPPDLYLCSSSLNMKAIPTSNKVLAPIPIDEDKYPFVRRSGKAKVFLHQSGTDGLYGYNETHKVIEAFKKLPKDCILKIQTPKVLSAGAVPVTSSDPRIIVIPTDTVDSVTLFEEPADVYVLPQNIRATSLSIQEAMMVGLPVITTNYAPFNEFIHKDLLVKVKTIVHAVKDKVGDIYRIDDKTFLRPVTSYNCCASDIGTKMKKVTGTDIGGYSDYSRKNAEKFFGWSNVKSIYMNAFQSYHGKQHGKSVVTFTDTYNHTELYQSKLLEYRYTLELDISNTSHAEKSITVNNQVVKVLPDSTRRNSYRTYSITLDQVPSELIINDTQAKFPMSIGPIRVGAVRLTAIPVVQRHTKTILYIGNFHPSHSTENHLAYTLETLGFHVFRVQENEITVDRTIEYLKSIPVVFLLYTRTWGMDGDVYSLWDYCKQNKIPTVTYHLDLYVKISREKTLAYDPFWKTKYVFTTDNDPYSNTVYEKHDINHTWLRAAVFYPECYRAEPNPKWKNEVIFVGTSTNYHTEWPYRQQLVKFLASTFKSKFKVYGNATISVRDHELNVLYASTKIVVGDTLCPNFTHEYYWSDRVYETLGRGGFMIFPRIKGIEDELVDGKHIVLYEYGNFEQLKTLINYYLEHDDEREAIRKAGFEYVREHCTYNNRLKELCDTVYSRERELRNQGSIVTSGSMVYIKHLHTGKYLAPSETRSDDGSRYVVGVDEPYAFKISSDTDHVINLDHPIKLECVEDETFLSMTSNISPVTKQKEIVLREYSASASWSICINESDPFREDLEILHENQAIVISNLGIDKRYLHSHHHLLNTYEYEVTGFDGCIHEWEVIIV